MIVFAGLSFYIYRWWEQKAGVCHKIKYSEIYGIKNPPEGGESSGGTLYTLLESKIRDEY